MARRLRLLLWIGATLGVVLSRSRGLCQAPVIETTQSTAVGPAMTPGSTQSRLGPMPGAGAMILGNQPGRGDLLLGRLGPSMPRVPTAITTPGNQGLAVQQRGIVAPLPLPAPRAPLYGSLDLPAKEDEEGPADGLTLDQAIERLVHQNYDLLSNRMEIPQARADILTASLRANPIVYADTPARALRLVQRPASRRTHPV